MLDLSAMVEFSVSGFKCCFDSFTDIVNAIFLGR